MREAAFIDLLRGLATDPAARELRDDAAVLSVGGARLVLTGDTLVEGVHYRPDDPPDSVGWKLAAVNLSDLAAKGARPVACLMGHALSGDPHWDAAFVRGLGEALTAYGLPLIGGDTVRAGGAARSHWLAAIGEATTDPVPARAGAKAGDRLYVTGPVGDAGAGLALLETGEAEPALVEAYRRPRPRLAEGLRLAPHVNAMMDVSDGLLIDASRMAAASGLAVRVEAVPLSDALMALRGGSVEARMAAAAAGDDYELLFAAPGPVAGVAAMEVGRFLPGDGLTLSLDGRPVDPPARLGFEH